VGAVLDGDVGIIARAWLVVIFLTATMFVPVVDGRSLLDTQPGAIQNSSLGDFHRFYFSILFSFMDRRHGWLGSGGEQGKRRRWM